MPRRGVRWQAEYSVMFFASRTGLPQDGTCDKTSSRSAWYGLLDRPTKLMAFTTLARRATSMRIAAPDSSGVLITGSTPDFANAAVLCSQPMQPT